MIAMFPASSPIAPRGTSKQPIRTSVLVSARFGHRIAWNDRECRVPRNGTQPRDPPCDLSDCELSTMHSNVCERCVPAVVVHNMLYFRCARVAAACATLPKLGDSRVVSAVRHTRQLWVHTFEEYTTFPFTNPACGQGSTFRSPTANMWNIRREQKYTTYGYRNPVTVSYASPRRLVQAR